MKLFTISFISFISLFVNHVSAQILDYLEAGTQWSENILFKEYPCINQHNTIYFLDGDSTIGTHNYQKLHRRGIRQEYPQEGTPGVVVQHCSSTDYFNEFRVLIRQELKKLYVYHPAYGDTLLYDFDLQPGDTLPETINDFGVDIVSYVDSIAIGNGYRKVFHLAQSSMTIVEGIGSSNGLLHFFDFLAFAEYFYHTDRRCYKHSQGNIYFAGSASQCFWTMDIPEQSALNMKLNVFPNPATNSVQLTSGFSLDEIQKVEIINVLGENTNCTFYANESGIEVNLETLPAGLYLIRLKLESGWSSAVRVMKE